MLMCDIVFPTAKCIILNFRALYVLVVVQAVDIGSEPPKNLSDYSLQELRESTTAYNRARGRRQAMSRGGVYIAANISESKLDGGGFTLGDGTKDKGYINHALEPGLAYTVGLRSKVNGTNIPITVNSVSPQPISKSTNDIMDSDIWLY